MNIPLDQFEQIIDETILKRGLNYFRSGQVEEPEELSHGYFEAIVQGTDPYRVTVTIKDGTVTEHTCTCPYDMGPVCKHVVALLFALQEESTGIQKRRRKVSAESKEGKRSKSGRKTVMEQVNEILTRIPLESLTDFIREQCLRDPAFRRLFLAQFTLHLGGESKSAYAQHVKAILYAAKGQRGFIDWNRVGAVGKAVHDLMIMARKHHEMGNYQTSIFISCAVLEEMTKALQFADDSNGDIGGNVEEALELLDMNSTEDLPEENRKWLFDYVVTAVKKRLFEGWDWDVGIIYIAVNVMQGDKEGSILLELVESMPHSEYGEERIQEIKPIILRRSGREAEAEVFEASHMENEAFREQAIRRAMEKGNLDKAEEVAQEGIRQDEKDKPGLANKWVDWLLKIAMERKDRKTIIAHARYLFVQPNRDHTHYYSIMKSQVDPGEWPSFADELIRQFSIPGKWRDPYLLAWICIQEERWQTLLEVCSQHFTLNGIKEYEKYLADQYPVELAGIYKNRILELLDRSTGRNHYQEAARFIRRMKKIGAVIMAEGLIRQLQEKYPLRKALLEELEMV